jgi:hypothetical protein
MSDDTLIVILTTSSWKACTSPPPQGEPILVSIPNSIKKRLKSVGSVPFRISNSASKPSPELTFTPLDEDETDDIVEDQTILRMLQEGDLIFVPQLPGGTAQPIQRSTAWSDIPFIPTTGWNSSTNPEIHSLVRYPVYTRMVVCTDQEHPRYVTAISLPRYTFGSSGQG